MDKQEIKEIKLLESDCSNLDYIEHELYIDNNFCGCFIIPSTQLLAFIKHMRIGFGDGFVYDQNK